MGMLSSFIHKELLDHLTAQAVLGQHPFDAEFDDADRAGINHLFGSTGLLAAGIARVGLVFLLRQLVAGEADFSGIEHDDIIATVNVRRVRGLMLAAKHVGDLGEKAACDLSFCINNVPLVLNFFFFR